MIHVRSGGRTSRLAAALAALLTVTIAPMLAQPASATSSCTSTSVIKQGSLTFTIPTIGAGTKNTDCQLLNGNVSSAVHQLQVTLNLCYWNGSTHKNAVHTFRTKLDPDSHFGNLTESALKSAQTFEGIPHDGIYGPQTRMHLHFFAEDGLQGKCVTFGA
jgi:peptidoglycan hydrolase-like protein with peptidoglycan-binding domain